MITKPNLEFISHSLSAQVQLKSLSINLECNSIEEEGIGSLCRVIENNVQLTELDLNLNENSIGNNGLKTLSKAMENLASIKKLVLQSRRNGISKMGVLVLFLSLQNLPGIEELAIILDENGINNEKMDQMEDAIRKHMNLLRKLSLGFRNTGIGDEFCYSLAQGLKELKVI